MVRPCWCTCLQKAQLNSPEVNFKIMAFKGTAGKSASGASMSKYDVEVEGRLQALEAKVAALESHSHDAPAASGDVDVEQFRGLAEDVRRMRQTLGI